MKRILVAGLLLLPCTAVAEDCQVVEFPDHFEVTCTGDAKPVPIPKQSLAPASAPVQVTEQSQTPEQQNAPQQADTPAAAQPADAATAAVPGGPVSRKLGRQGRPSSANMNAAIEARRKLIQESGTKDQPAVQ